MKQLILGVLLVVSLQGCAVTTATILAASATGVAVAEDMMGIATKWHQMKKEWLENNETNRTR